MTEPCPAPYRGEHPDHYEQRLKEWRRPRAYGCALPPREHAEPWRRWTWGGVVGASRTCWTDRGPVSVVVAQRPDGRWQTAAGEVTDGEYAARALAWAGRPL